MLLFTSNGNMQDLGGFGPNSASNATFAYGINDHGQVVGFGYIQGQNGVALAHAFLYTSGRLLDLGTLQGYTSSVATGINNRGEIVGYCDNDTSSAPFLDVSGQMYNVTALLVPNAGWTVIAVPGINDSGQIAATGIRNNVGHALLLTPVN
jgi:probable HAF family extracellular repeat protein